MTIPMSKKIRIYGASWMVNMDTKQLLVTALNDKKMEVWPGVSFTTDTPEGKALLASPIGRTIAFFLMQHKAELDFKIVSKVTVVEGKVTIKPVTHMFFNIEDVPPPTADPPPPNTDIVLVYALDAALPPLLKRR